MDYIELTVNFSPRIPWADIYLAYLAEEGFESFVETDQGIQAYAPATSIDIEQILAMEIFREPSPEVHIEYFWELIEQQNWNAVWEADFQPVHIEDKLTILAPFHSREGAVGMIVEIQPQMSFGTGHHQTTWMMSKALFDEKQLPTRILDMGTGTGVLAVIAEKLGAEEILAIDIEDWSVQNTIENAERNQCSNITALHGDIDLIEGRTFDMILANINKNILKKHLPDYAQSLAENGVLYLSGFFETDTEELIEAAAAVGLKYDRMYTKETWAALRFVR